MNGRVKRKKSAPRCPANGDFFWIGNPLLDEVIKHLRQAIIEFCNEVRIPSCPMTPTQQAFGLTQATINPGGQVVRNLSGELTLQVAKLLKPSKMETRKTLLTLRRDLKLSRGQMAAILGVCKTTLRRWETGQRQPSAATQKLIWLIHNLCHPSRRAGNLLDIAMWGQI